MDDCRPEGESDMVTLESDSRSGAIFGETELQVNSLHHQAARGVGEGLCAVTYSSDGMIEATERMPQSIFVSAYSGILNADARERSTGIAGPGIR